MRITFILLLTVALITGCASIVSKSNYSVSINSDPDGASFKITNSVGTVATGTTPEVVTLSSGKGYFKKESYEITLTKQGYDEKTYTLYSTIDGWYWGNFVIGGLLGMLIVDPITGAMYKLPDRVDIPLAGQVSAPPESIDIRFASIDSLSHKERMRLIRIDEAVGATAR